MNALPFDGSLENSEQATALFPVLVTDVATGSPPTFTWVEQTFDAATGAYSNAISPRSGDKIAGPFLVQLNGAQLTPPFYAWARLRGIVAGSPYYEMGLSGQGTITVQTNTCPVLAVVSGVIVVVALTVEYTTYSLADGSILSRWCVTDPTGCCGGSGSGSGTGSGSGSCCPGTPTQLCLTISNDQQTPNLNGHYLLTESLGGWFSGSFAYGSFTAQWQLVCLPTNTWELTLNVNASGEEYVERSCLAASVTCSPFSVGNPSCAATLGSWGWSVTSSLTACGGGSGSGSGGGGPITTPCCPGGLPTTLHATVGGTLACLNGTYAMTWDAVHGWWQFVGTLCGGFDVRVKMTCNGTDCHGMTLSVLCGGQTVFSGTPTTSCDCNAPQFGFGGTTNATVCGAGGLGITVSVTS